MRRFGAFAALFLVGALGAPGLASAQASITQGVGAAPAPGIERGESLAARLTPLAGAPTLLRSAWPSEPSIDASSRAFATPLRQARVRDRRGIPYMVAGGILFVAGAIVGDDVGTLLILGGAGVGAYGAYVYFGG